MDMQIAGVSGMEWPPSSGNRAAISPAIVFFRRAGPACIGARGSVATFHHQAGRSEKLSRWSDARRSRHAAAFDDERTG